VVQLTLSGLLPVTVPFRLVGASSTVVRAGPALAVGGWLAITVKALLSDATSEPVVNVTSRGPGVAAGSIFNTAVALALEFIVRDATVIPAPKLAVVIPCVKCVNCPAIAADRFCCPCWPVPGMTEVITGTTAAFTLIVTVALEEIIPSEAARLRT